ncbi:hypothetical protein B296_00017273 [Ensete ventricosum]|uniref:Uncharacterized protein n=1 Tax=Ensete ventricosum TaxID=4639 RepID=A0A426ZUR8_ENSVE|nr:hypothetical protein B296_00017273 [Ensete ventricosum]
MANAYVKRVMIDTGSLTDILYFDAFQKLGLTDRYLATLTSTLTGFTGDSVFPLGVTTTPVMFGGEPKLKTLMVSFMVVKLPSAYNAIIGRPTLNRLKAVVLTYHRILKFPTRAGVGESSKAYCLCIGTRSSSGWMVKGSSSTSASGYRAWKQTNVTRYPYSYVTRPILSKPSLNPKNSLYSVIVCLGSLARVLSKAFTTYSSSSSIFRALTRASFSNRWASARLLRTSCSSFFEASRFRSASSLSRLVLSSSSYSSTARSSALATAFGPPSDFRASSSSCSCLSR